LPFGDYRQEVEVEFKGRSYSFSGVMRRTPEKLVLVGLSPVHATVFTLTDVAGAEEIQLETQAPLLKPYKDYVVAGYESLKPLIEMGERDLPDWKIGLCEAQSYPLNMIFNRSGLHVAIKNIHFKELGHP
jgi:hypothetical protein